jgi:hypothetical protein
MRRRHHGAFREPPAGRLADADGGLVHLYRCFCTCVRLCFFGECLPACDAMPRREQSSPARARTKEILVLLKIIVFLVLF